MMVLINNILLRPLSWIYGLIIFIRNFLYDEHIFVTRTVPVPTICVGNLAVGGTGKTPMVEYLLRLLSPMYKVAVVSLGYGRKTRGYRLATAQDTALTIGDEPSQIHQAFPNIPIAVAKDRVDAIKRLLRQYPDLDVVILDDALQYRRLKSEYNILLTSAENLYVDDHLLPFGRLRDLKIRAEKVNAVVVTRCPAQMTPIDRRVISNKLKLFPFQNLSFASTRYADIHLDATPLLLTGIANPQMMLQYVQTKCPNVTMMAYDDHHSFSARDVEEILTRAQDYSVVLTTSKDYQRLLLTKIPEILGDKLQVLTIEHNMGEDAENFARPILRLVGERKRIKKQ